VVQYLEILIKHKLVIVLATVLACAVATLASFLMPPIYRSSTTLRVVASAQTGSVDSVDYRYADRLMNTYVAILGSRPVFEEVKERLGLGSSPGHLSTKVSVEALPETELIKISVEDGDSSRAMEIANALAALLVERSESLYSGGGKSAREILEEQLVNLETDLQERRASLYGLMDDPSPDYATIDALNARIMLEEETYAMLLREYEQARVAEAMRAGSITVVEQAIQAVRPTSPNKPLYIALGALVGLGAGAGLAFLLENLRATASALGPFSLRKRALE
jgi:capsular polysaccharide biosynthesis protein